MTFKPIDNFCLAADANEELPPLTGKKKWADYRLTPPEWKLVKLVHHCLQVCQYISVASLDLTNHITVGCQTTQ
jgi:hypothetical protein